MEKINKPAKKSRRKKQLDDQGNLLKDKEGNAVLETLSDSEDRLEYSLVGLDDYDVNMEEY
jgi:hypothetical protein